MAYWRDTAGGGGALLDGDLGDIVVSGVGTVLTIDTAAVTYAKLQLPAGSDVVLGKTFASPGGRYEELNCTAAGRGIIGAADIPAQRTHLGLGTLATQSGTFSGTSSGTNTGDQTITLSGDVSGTGTGAITATIANDAVTYAKMQNISATDKLLGRSTAGAGDVEEIACTAAGRAILDDATAADQRTTLGVLGFSTIAVSGQSDVVADTSLDTLTLVAGSNVTITTSAGGDSITFAQSAGGTTTTVATIAALKALTVGTLTDKQLLYVQGYYADNDGGQGLFYYSSGSTATDDGGAVIQPTAGAGRFLRVWGELGRYPVRAWGAKASNSSADAATNTTAIDKAITYLLSGIARVSGLENFILDFEAGNYYTNGHMFNNNGMVITGSLSGGARLIHANGNFKPLLHLTGGVNLSSVPYGGIHRINLVAGDSTFPAVLYYEAAIDNQTDFDELTIAGNGSAVSEALKCDGFSIPLFLNFSMRRYRNDTIGGYGFRVRGSSCLALRASTTNSGVNAWEVATNGFLTDGTGKVTSGNGTNVRNSMVPPGTAVTVHVQTAIGNMPIPNDTGTRLLDLSEGGIYFVGKDSDHDTLYLHRTKADAIAGTNKLIWSTSNAAGVGFSVFQSAFTVNAVDTVANTLKFLNDRNVMIATAVAESGMSKTYGSGYVNTVTTGGAGAAGGLHVVFVASDGTMPGGLTAGVAYYPIYVDARTIKLATSVANAVAGTAIDITSAGTGNITIIYDHQISTLGIGTLSIDAWTFDNGGSATQETINGLACGSLGMMYADFSWVTFQGAIHVRGNRTELNKCLARDSVYGSNKRAIFRVECGIQPHVVGPHNVSLTIEDMEFDSPNAQKGENTRVVGNRGVGDLAPNFHNCLLQGIGQGYDNDTGTARSKTIPNNNGTRQFLHNIIGGKNSASYASGFRNDGHYQYSNQGSSNGLMASAQWADSITKNGDLFLSADVAFAYYKAVQSTTGWCKDTGSDTAATVTGTTGAGAVFNMAAVTGANVGIGTAIKIPGAGAAAADLIGVIKDIDNLSATPTLTLGDPTTGADLPCLTDVTSVTATWRPSVMAGVRAWYSVSAAVNFDSIPANSTQDKTIAVPTNVTFTEGKPCILGIPAAAPSGIVYNAFVSSGGTSVTIRAANVTGVAIDPVSMTFTVDVAV